MGLACGETPVVQSPEPESPVVAVPVVVEEAPVAVPVEPVAEGLPLHLLRVAAPNPDAGFLDDEVEFPEARMQRLVIERRGSKVCECVHMRADRLDRPTRFCR